MANAGQTYNLRIDGQPHAVRDPVLTGRQILALAGKAPVEEHLVFLLTPDRIMEDLSLEETTDLRSPGVEDFLTFRNDRSFRFELDGKRQDWGAPTISEATLKRLAGVGAGYSVWMEKKKEEDRLLTPGELVDLTQPGVERFYTGRSDTNAGLVLALPEADRRYLEDRGLAYEVVAQDKQKAVIFKAYPVPHGRFGGADADLLILLPPGYPDAAPDMFYTDPWLNLVSTGRPPEKADVPHAFLGRRWQRWSRHNSEWRTGTDGIHTMLRRVDAALRGESQ